MSAKDDDGVMRARLAAVVIGVVLSSVVSVTPADAAQPVRSGTILFGVFLAGPQGCAWSPDCMVWLESGCDGRLTGLDPAVSTSIVDVHNLAGSWRRVVATPGDNWVFRTNYEFWSSGCRNVGVHLSDEGPFKIPRGARWMTIPSSVGPLRWELW